MAHLIPRDTRFVYRKLERMDTSAGRVYKVPNFGHVPSVTTILDRTKDKAQLEAWAQRVGAQEASRQKEEAAYIGTHMHATLEAIVLGEPIVFGKDWKAMKGHEMALRLANKYLPNLDALCGAEVSVHLHGQYAGTTDLVGVYRGKLAIVDFKQSVRPKRHEFITDYFHQLAAYAIAHDSMYGTDIDFAAVLVAVQDGTTQEFTTTGREFQDFKAGWMERLKRSASSS